MRDRQMSGGDMVIAVPHVKRLLISHLLLKFLNKIIASSLPAQALRFALRLAL